MKQVNYKTRQKTAILQCIEGMGDKHFTIDELCDILNKKGETAGRTTVYRMVEKLSNDGVLQKYVMPQGESSCYQYVGVDNRCHEHFHLKCERCGSLIHMDCDEMDTLAKHIKEHHGFNLNPLKTVIYGVCEGCAAK